MAARLVPVQVVGVTQQVVDDEVVVLLLDPVTQLYVPIVVGPFEATAVATAMAGLTPPRPMTHDLLRDVIAALGGRLDRVEVTALVSGVFHARLVLDDDVEVDARASDAIALAVRVGCPVLCAVDVVAEAGVTAVVREADDEVERFREFLDQVTPEDFAAGSDDDEPGPDEPSDDA